MSRRIMKGEVGKFGGGINEGEAEGDEGVD